MGYAAVVGRNGIFISKQNKKRIKLKKKKWAASKDVGKPKQETVRVERKAEISSWLLYLFKFFWVLIIMFLSLVFFRYRQIETV